MKYTIKRLKNGYWTILDGQGHEVANTIWETREKARHDLKRIKIAK